MACSKELLIIATPCDETNKFILYTVIIGNDILYKGVYFSESKWIKQIAYETVSFIRRFLNLNVENRVLTAQSMGLNPEWIDVAIRHNLRPDNVHFSTLAGNTIIPQSVGAINY